MLSIIQLFFFTLYGLNRGGGRIEAIDRMENSDDRAFPLVGFEHQSDVMSTVGGIVLTSTEKLSRQAFRDWRRMGISPPLRVANMAH